MSAETEIYQPGSVLVSASELQRMGLKKYQNEGKIAEAGQLFELAANIEPGSAELPFNAGRCAMDLSDWFAAAYWNRRALELNPAHYGAMCNLSVALLWLGENEQAALFADLATQTDAKLPHGWSARGFAAMHSGDPKEALRFWDIALSIDPNFPEAAFNKAAVQLEQLDFSAGSPEFYKWKNGGQPDKFSGFTVPPCPAWAGEAMTDKTILIWGEQGLGDQILFAGMVNEVCDRAKKVILCVTDQLVPLFARAFPRATVVPHRHATYIRMWEVDLHCPLGALPAFLRKGREDFTPPESYLTADPDRVKAIRARYKKIAGDRPLIGVSWASDSRYGVFKSTELDEHWGPIFATPGVQFISLQYGLTRHECRGIMPSPREVDGTHIESWAALIGAMDAVISVSNTAVHFAGAMGIPTLAMIPRGAGRLWYWFDLPRDEAGTMDCLWYPSVRLIPQERVGDWEGPIAVAAKALREISNT